MAASQHPGTGKRCRLAWPAALAGLVVMLLLLLGCPVKGLAQYYIQGQDPSDIRWQQIENKHFRVLFPEDYADQAQRIADILMYSYPRGSATMGHRPRKVPVILHNRTVVPNGFVSWAPARLEMFANPPPDNDQHDWLERLAVHEFRHVVQVDKLNQGFTGFFARLFGEHVTGISLGLFVPLWFLEGDAVAAETGLTHGGRGRRPSFEQGLRAQVLEKGIYSYEKAMLGSYLDHVPNHYELGYQLVSAARMEYGANIWDKVMENTARRPYTVFPFSLGLEKNAGIGQEAHYYRSFQQLDSAWKEQEASHVYSGFQEISPDKSFYTNYRPIGFSNDSTLIALKTGLEDIPRVVSVGQEKDEAPIFTPGYYNSEGFTLGGGMVAWSETRPDPRWTHRSWSEVHLYDLDRGSHKRLTRKTRYFSPAVSPDGSLVVVTEVTARNEYSLVLLNATSGMETARFPSPGNAYLMQPRWHPGGESVVAVAQNQDGKRIISLDTETGQFTTLYHAGHYDISRPRYLNGAQLLFTGPFSGIDNIYMLDTDDGSVNMLVSARFGSVDAVPAKEEDGLVWADYTADGYRIAYRSELPAMIPADSVEDHSVGFHRMLARQEGDVVSGEKIPAGDYEISDYRKLDGLFNVHSWGPFALEMGTLGVSPGVSLFSQNLLSTSTGMMGYSWDMNERLGTWFLQYTYMGHYPVFDLRAETGLRRARYLDTFGEPGSFLWREWSVKPGIRIPLSFRKGAVTYDFTPSVEFGFARMDEPEEAPEFFQSQDLFSLAYRISALRRWRQVARDIRPQKGQMIDLQYRHTPFGGGDMGKVFAASFSAYFPGAGRHHSLMFSAFFQDHQESDFQLNTIDYGFPGLISHPRGARDRRDAKLFGVSLDYAFPLGYPEWIVPWFLYVKRIHLNIFADYARATPMSSSSVTPVIAEAETLTSTGVDVVGDMHILRFFSPVRLGLRSIYLPGEDQWDFRLLFFFEI
ncbi:MAG: TolB family protein [Bacteroidales bacterium]